MRYSSSFPARLRLAVLAVTLAVSGADAASAKYDLVVYGGTPQGVTTAAAAAREGLNVLLVEPGPGLGGVLTRSWLATLDVTTDGTGSVLQGGLFRKFYRELGHDNSFDLSVAQRTLDAMLPGTVNVTFNTRLANLDKEDGTVSTATFAGPVAFWTASAPYFVDATDTAEFAAQAGANFTVGRGDTHIDDAQMASTLVFKVSNVDFDALKAELAREHKELGNGAGVFGRSIVGLWPTAKGYRASDPTRFRLRGFNAARQDDGSLLVNALLIFGVDGTSAASRQRAWREGQDEARRVVTYLKKSLPNVFAQSRMAGVAPELYVRESRHLVGVTRLHADDVLYGRTFPDGVALGGYPLDGQAYLPFETPYLLGEPAPYEVPFSTLVPNNLRNVLVVSQAASFDAAAAFSARVAPLQMNLGEAAGLAVKAARTRRLDFPSLLADPGAVNDVRSAARRSGLIDVQRVSRPRCDDERHSNYDAAVELLRRSLFTTPYYYQGCLHLSEPQDPRDFLADLEHAAGVKSQKARDAVDALKGRFGKGTPLSSVAALDALRALAPSGPRVQFAANQPRLDRGRAALLRWQALQPDRPA
ncbi:FAD-dependent oxidoreductase [Deinococcus yavapaiensis]|uniref:FAD dependent oxidoreductase n=1 Tax=Deinococcus yavapaiensis KR-236 TaxID=694435 RepID=A0A318SC07_9DEIO|nr:FAD-dependent oxidoreductase [Deinococcus yavapaiensis]PYE56361.1 FAD dependent oxidoreductase [Deinococcus yavapaiensis KR-236]